ncbi:ComEC/Rec2 family competence protein [Cohnella soli]|uniref:ComEC/Rec2 family competence protein n=1 Tax=Cohnella soli TaxID=425005 RepID=A0ABW0HRI7_9BACL
MLKSIISGSMRRAVPAIFSLAMLTACGNLPTAGAPGATNDNAQAETPQTGVLQPPAKGKLSVYFLDIGQGDSTYIKTAAGDDILIDGGKNDAGARVVEYLKQLGVDDLEIVIATHPDSDHIGGLDTVIKSFNVKAVYAPKVSHTTDSFKDFLLAVKQAGRTIKEAKAGVQLPLQGTEAVFVGPAKSYGDDLNDWSAVVHLSYGTTSFLFTGDAEKKSEKDMIETGAKLKADVLKVGHHGSVSSTSEAFLQAVAPTYAVISVGRNSYGHPAETVLNRLENQGVSVFRTDTDGTVTIVSDGKKLQLRKVR